jgi:hypothetical protein
MATADEYAAWIVKNSAKRGTPEFDTVAKAYRAGQGQRKLRQSRSNRIAPPPSTSRALDQLIGAGETALTLGTACTGGTLGTLAGTLQGLSQQILSGQFGTPEAMRAVEQAAAAEGAQALTYQPRTQAGQEQVQAVGQVLANVLPPVLPMIAAPGAIMQATRQAAPIVKATAQRGAAAAQQAATATGQAIARPGKRPLQQCARPLAWKRRPWPPQPAAGARAVQTPVSLNAATYLMAESPVGKVGGVKTADGIKINYAHQEEREKAFSKH